MDCGTIYFYDRPSDRVKEEHIFLNNFYYSPFTIDGIEYKTVEHYYQAKKFAGDQFHQIIQTATPDEAKKLAHEFTCNEVEWSQVKDNIMREALEAKFSQHQELRQKLLDTGSSKLIEDSSRDPYWGGILEGSKNRLGELLEELRESYRKANI